MDGHEKKEKALQAAAIKSSTTPAWEDFEKVFQLHNKLVFRAAYRVTGNASDAEDVMQTVFLRLLKKERALNLGENPGGYLHRAAVNAALDLLRSRRSSRNVPLDEVSSRMPKDLAPDPEDRRHASEIREWLRRAVANLNSTAAEMFVLRYFEGFGNQEIARIMGTSQGTVAVTLHRTRSRLQEEIGALFKRN